MREDLEVSARVLDVLAVGPFHEAECPADARIDVDARKRARRGREQPAARQIGIKPGVERALRRGAETPSNADHATPARHAIAFLRWYRKSSRASSVPPGRRISSIRYGPNC